MASARPDRADVRRGAGAASSLVKLTLAVVALALVLRKVDLGELRGALGRIGARDLATLLALYAAQTAIGVVRWWRLLRRLGERVPFGALARDVAVGLTFNMFLPTGLGGDVIRAIRASRRVTRAHRAWSSSIFERIAGLVALAATGGLAATLGLGAEAAFPWSLRAAAAGLAVALVVAFAFAGAPFRLVARLARDRLPSAALGEIDGIAADLEGPLATGGARVEALAWSSLGQAVGLLFVIAGAAALGAPGHERAIVIGMPLVFVLSIAPLTLGGHGLREGLYVTILGALGVPAGVALGLATTFLGASVVFAVAGAGVLVVESPGQSRWPRRGPR